MDRLGPDMLWPGLNLIQPTLRWAEAGLEYASARPMNTPMFVTSFPQALDW